VPAGVAGLRGEPARTKTFIFTLLFQANINEEEFKANDHGI